MVLDIEQCASEDTGPPREVDCEIPHRLRRGTKHFLQGRENFSLVDMFKTVRLTAIRNGQKRTISDSGVLEAFTLGISPCNDQYDIDFLLLESCFRPFVK